MKNIILYFIFTMLCFSLSAQNNKVSDLYVGTFTSEGAEGIYLCRFDHVSGKVSLQNVFKGIDNPSFLKISPERKFLYAVTRPVAEADRSIGYVEAYKIDSAGGLHFINKQRSNGADPCHIDVSHDGKFAAIATYGGGTISLYEINPDGSLSKADTTIKFVGSGFNSSRQKTPHAHSVLFSNDNSQLFSADLGTDRLNIFNLKNKKLEYAGQSHVDLAPGAGPRHFTFHPDSKTIFVINELNSTITVLKKSSEKWQEVQTVSTLPKGFSGDNYCADIHISADGRYLYGSNRGHNSIAVYKVDSKTKKLDWVTAVSTQGNWPRNFTLTSDGKFLLAANQKSNNITVFSINPENGIPKFTGNEMTIPAPVCLVF